MIIECPGCQETYEVDVPSLAAGGVEIHCKNCARQFLIRPHGAHRAGDSHTVNDLPAPPSPLLAEPDSLSAPATGNGIATEVDPSIFLQRDEIPYAMVEAYEGAGNKMPQVLIEEEDETWQAPEKGRARDEEQPDLLLEPEEKDEPEPIGGLADDELFSTPYPLGKDLVIGRRRSRNWVRLLLRVGLAAVLVVLLALVARNCSIQESWQRVKDLGQGALSLLPLNRLESGKIHISDLNGAYQDRAGKESPVFVIEGTVTNRHRSPCHSIQVKGTLFDERGNRAMEEVVYCGNLLTKEQLRSYPRKKIEEILQNAYGETLSNFNIEPGKSVPFMVIFFDPPGKLSEFSLEVYHYTLQEPGNR
jgi:predicted Zn finger-like uncharacterized protein